MHFNFYSNSGVLSRYGFRFEEKDTAGSNYGDKNLNKILEYHLAPLYNVYAGYTLISSGFMEGIGGDGRLRSSNAYDVIVAFSAWGLDFGVYPDTTHNKYQGHSLRNYLILCLYLRGAVMWAGRP